jgi:F420-dependent oxidoreductase-like protein
MSDSHDARDRGHRQAGSSAPYRDRGLASGPGVENLPRQSSLSVAATSSRPSLARGAPAHRVATPCETRGEAGMRVGLQLPSFTWPGAPDSIPGRLVEIAQAAEQNGFASLWVMDHFFQLPPTTPWEGPDKPMLEAYTTLGLLAGATTRIRLGPLVAAAIHRHPGVLVKTATTLDVVSNGRSYLGLGAGWYEREARGVGIPFPPRAERFERLEETLQIVHLMWSGRPRPFQGRHYRLEEPLNNPGPVARPHPPILVGGGGERRTLRLVARYADACNILVPDPGESARKLEALKRHCEALGRAYEEIEKTSLVEIDLRPGRMSARDVVGALRAQATEGIEHVIVNLPDVHDLRYLDTLGREVLPEVDTA